MGHDHRHAPVTAGGVHSRRLVVVLVLTLAVLAAEIVGAVLSGSLALLADAGHMATDAAGIGLALAAVSLAQRPARGRRSIGHPPEIDSGLMLAIAAVGLVVNLVSLSVLHRGRTDSLNVRGAYLEVL